MEIGNNKVVSLTYTLTVNGKEIETVKAESPLQFIFGSGMLLPKFEEQIIGKQEGDSFEFLLVAKDAYGEPNPQAVVELPMNLFERDGKVEEGILTIGNMLPMQDSEGNRLNGVVKDVKPIEKKVVMDFNHPLAGADLNFKGKVEKVREATEKEAANGLFNEKAQHSCGDCRDGGCDGCSGCH